MQGVYFVFSTSGSLNYRGWRFLTHKTMGFEHETSYLQVKAFSTGGVYFVIVIAKIYMNTQRKGLVK